MEFNDVYDKYRNLTGKYGLVVCVWVYDGKGNLLLTRRAPGKSFAGTWENSGGAAKAGENSRTAIARELFENATDVNFFVGRAINPAHQNPNLPITFAIKQQLITNQRLILFQSILLLIFLFNVLLN